MLILLLADINVCGYYSVAYPLYQTLGLAGIRPSQLKAFEENKISFLIHQLRLCSASKVRAHYLPKYTCHVFYNI